MLIPGRPKNISVPRPEEAAFIKATLTKSKKENNKTATPRTVKMSGVIRVGLSVGDTAWWVSQVIFVTSAAGMGKCKFRSGKHVFLVSCRARSRRGKPASDNGKCSYQVPVVTIQIVRTEARN